MARALASFVSIIGAIVMFGWFLDIESLKSILPYWVTMKFSTAISFFMSGITLFFISEIVEGRKAMAQVVIPITTFIILMIMVTLLVSTAFGIRTGVEDLFVQEAEGVVDTTVPGRPSIGTMICFILLETAGFLAIFTPDRLAPKLAYVGFPVVGLGASAIAGYLVGAKILYYSIPNTSTAMAFHTAILFVLLGSGLVLTSRQDEKTS